MRSDDSNPDYKVVRGERFNCKLPEELNAAIERAENHVSDIKKYLSALSSHHRQCIKILKDLKSMQSKQNPKPTKP